MEEGERLTCTLPRFDPALPDAVGGWLAGMNVDGATVRTTHGDQPAVHGWPRPHHRVGDWILLNPHERNADGLCLDYDPGICFGTGAHPTTETTAVVLRRVAGTIELAGAKVLDVGCGGGLFTVALAKLGAHATAVDVWAECVKTTLKNAERNGVSARVTVTQTAARDLPDADYDLIVANLAPSMDLAPTLTRLTNLVVIAGLQAGKLEEAARRYSPLREVSRHEHEGWGAIALSR
jgi:ribosomal protein L11 methylase PrmA